MTNAEKKREQLAACANAAADCSGSADYAARAFREGNENDGRAYFGYLRENVARLESEIFQLDRANMRIGRYGADSEFIPLLPL